MIHFYNITDSYLTSNHLRCKTWEVFFNIYDGKEKLWIRPSKLRDGHVWVITYET